MMAQVQSGGIDTSPKIAEYGTCWGASIDGINTNANWCRTEWYEMNPSPGRADRIYGYVGADSRNQSFQYKGISTLDGSIKSDWYYWNGTVPRPIQITDTNLVRISFSIEISAIDSSYAYSGMTGQIYFAGRNTPYFGYKNINDMPTGT